MTLRVDKVSGGKAWQEYIKKKYLSQKKPQVRVGILDGATYSQDHYQNFMTTKTQKNGKTKRVARQRAKPRQHIPKIIEVAFWNEFGTVRAPQRSFLRTTLQEKSTEWVRTLAKLMKTMSLQHALESLGNIMVDDVVKKIKSGIGPELAPFTLEQRKANKISGKTPLMASREMITALDFNVDI